MLRNLYRWLGRRGVLRYNPLAEVESPVLPKKIARSLSKEELPSLLQHPDHSRVVRDFLLADTGLRLSESLSIRSTDQVYRNTVFATGKVGERQIPISPLAKGMVVDVLTWPWGSGQPAGLAVRWTFASWAEPHPALAISRMVPLGDRHCYGHDSCATIPVVVQ